MKTVTEEWAELAGNNALALRIWWQGMVAR